MMVCFISKRNIEKIQHPQRKVMRVEEEEEKEEKDKKKKGKQKEEKKKSGSNNKPKSFTGKCFLFGEQKK